MRIISAVHPTDNQKRVMAKIVAAPTPSVAAQTVAGDANLVAARNMLMNLGLITFVNGDVSLTDKGMQVASDENIVDQSGQLTQVGQELAYTDSKGNADQDQQAPPNQMESFSLLKQLLS